MLQIFNSLWANIYLDMTVLTQNKITSPNGLFLKHEHYEVTIYEKKGIVGEHLDFVYEDGECGMNHYFWGSEIDYEYNRHGEVEKTGILMRRTPRKSCSALEHGTPRI
ncbi:MAG: hypothetical protein II934_10180 [Prevotella sp.]|nr:hypothetical protein [Prevotella sp.]